MNDKPDFAVGRTYSLSLRHIQLVKEMRERIKRETGIIVSEGRIVRDAIDLLAANLDTKAYVEELEATPQV